MEARDQSIAVPAAVGIGLLVVALIFRGFFGVALALGALAPGGYVVWLGTQCEKQSRFVAGLLLMLSGLVIAALLLLGRLFAFFT